MCNPILKTIKFTEVCVTGVTGGFVNLTSIYCIYQLSPHSKTKIELFTSQGFYTQKFLISSKYEIESFLSSSPTL